MEAHPGAMQAHLRAIEITLEQWRLTLEPWRLTLELWRLTLEAYVTKHMCCSNKFKMCRVDFCKDDTELYMKLNHFYQRKRQFLKNCRPPITYSIEFLQFL
jgi:hypothetical protein